MILLLIFLQGQDDTYTFKIDVKQFKGLTSFPSSPVSPVFLFPEVSEWFHAPLPPTHHRCRFLLESSNPPTQKQQHFHSYQWPHAYVWASCICKSLVRFINVQTQYVCTTCLISKVENPHIFYTTYIFYVHEHQQIFIPSTLSTIPPIITPQVCNFPPLLISIPLCSACKSKVALHKATVNNIALQWKSKSYAQWWALN